MADSNNKSDSQFPLAGIAKDGWTKDGSATATCFCGAVQLAFPTEAPGLLGTFVCNCTDCRKITASMFATNFTIADTHLTHIRGQERLTVYRQSHTTTSGKAMTNSFCSTCGTLMYRIGDAHPGKVFMRVGTVDDFSLHETKLRPQRENYVDSRVSWLSGVADVKQMGNPKARV